MLGFDMNGLRDNREAHPNQRAPAVMRVHIPAVNRIAIKHSNPRYSPTWDGLEKTKSGLGKNP
jgi:hypothetical protein